MSCCAPISWPGKRHACSALSFYVAQAADIVRIVGIGRNEYIATMNKCKAKKLLWRMNKAVVKEHLPTEPLEFLKQPWWIAHVVNLGELACLRCVI